MTDNRVYRSRSLGVPASGLADQYADGTAAHLWDLYIGDTATRTSYYRNFVTKQLRVEGCQNVLDVACGTGIDSIMLLEEDFRLSSVDLSDKMLKCALKTRWQRRKEPAFDNWIIEEANWLTLPEDLSDSVGSFDAVICLGNSFAHLPLLDDMDAHGHAIENFCQMLKPGGILLIDHRNFDHILKHGKAPSKNIYYNSPHIQSIKTSIVMQEGNPTLVTLDYIMKSSETNNKFRLSYFPHQVDNFSQLLKKNFGPNCKHSVYGDFKPLGEVTDPGFFIHVIQKSK